MDTRVVFTDGTEKIFKDCNQWDRDSNTGFYSVQRRLKEKPPEPIYKTKLFSREVDVTIPEQGYTEENVAFIEICHVVYIEEIK